MVLLMVHTQTHRGSSPTVHFPIKHCGYYQSTVERRERGQGGREGGEGGEGGGKGGGEGRGKGGGEGGEGGGKGDVGEEREEGAGGKGRLIITQQLRSQSTRRWCSHMASVPQVHRL